MSLGERTHYAEPSGSDDLGQDAPQGLGTTAARPGSPVFVDLRDREGIVQLVFRRPAPGGLRRRQGPAPRVRHRREGQGGKNRTAKDVNPHMATGAFEVEVFELDVSWAQPRRRPSPWRTTPVSETCASNTAIWTCAAFQNARIVARHRLAQRTRNFLSGEGFIEIETPFLTKSTPEGARDFLVPSRLRPGTSALPRSPQLFKQSCMVAGFDRYFQVVRCFRDEDLRADRQLEFTQIDIEMSFPTEDLIMSLAERLALELFAEAGVAAPENVPRLTYAQAMDRFGCDKPDTRFGLELSTVTQIAAGTSFGVFNGAIAAGGV